jgi:hypothetical protein
MNNWSLVTSFLNWLGGLIGTMALLAGLSFLPGLFGRQESDHVLITISDFPLSRDILSYFNWEWGIALIVIATTLFVFVCLFFSMSTHDMVVSTVEMFGQTDSEGELAAWGIVVAIDLSLITLFVVILYGSLTIGPTLLISGLILLAMASLLVANYAEIKAQ